MKIDVADGSVEYFDDFLDIAMANQCLAILQEETVWRQDYITVYDKTRLLPRLQQWHGDTGRKYTWSGIEMSPLPWTDTLLRLRQMVSDRCGTHFNSVLLNLYRDGRDTVGWHSDDEPELGLQPVIASISLGAVRDFVLRRKEDNKHKIALPLAHGSLLKMGRNLQRYWQHSLPRRSKITTPRINLTFRYMHNNIRV